MKKKVLLIVNPVSGSKDKTQIVEDAKALLALEKYEVEAVYTEYPGHASELAAATDADIVVAVGGDGTQNEVARSLVGTDKVMGIIPCGSGDGLALHLGISRNNVVSSSLLTYGHVATIDYGTVNSLPFFCTMGVGLDALVSENFALSGRRGLSTYILESIKTWFGFNPDYYKVYVDDNLVWCDYATLITVGNANQWGNNAKITSQASVKDGELDVVIVKKVGLSAFPGLLLNLVKGTSYLSEHVVYSRGKQIRIERCQNGPIHIDGDPHSSFGISLNIEVHPAALKIIVPNENNI